mmetsp:Transcript_124347/g.264959  ORF Transcript_124347/g.264959 Transcript_124347/m.264959 type:complete len:222 (-) Transcript_124347:452-1117(-)
MGQHGLSLLKKACMVSSCVLRSLDGHPEAPCLPHADGPLQDLRDGIDRRRSVVLYFRCRTILRPKVIQVVLRWRQKSYVHADAFGFLDGILQLVGILPLARRIQRHLCRQLREDLLGLLDQLRVDAPGTRHVDARLQRPCLSIPHRDLQHLLRLQSFQHSLGLLQEHGIEVEMPRSAHGRAEPFDIAHFLRPLQCFLTLHALQSLHRPLNLLLVEADHPGL